MRIKKKFGIHIPPPRPKEPGQPITLEFVIGGIIPSKKNMQIPAFNHRSVYTQIKLHAASQEKFSRKTVWTIIRSIQLRILNSNKYQKWEADTKELLIIQAAQWKKSYEEKYGLSFPITRCSIHIRHCWKDRMARDNSNKAEGLHDALVSAGIISDDSYQCLFKTSSEAGCYKDEITDHVTVLYLTAYKW